MARSAFSSVISLAVFISALCFLINAQPAASNMNLLEVEKIIIYTPVPGENRKFNNGRPYVISINKYIDGADKSRKELITSLSNQKVLQKVVFEWYGKGHLEVVEIKIGIKVPVSISQAVLRAFAENSKTPIILTINHQDGAYGNTQRIYVGGLAKSGNPPASREKIKVLLTPGLTKEEFAKKAME